MKTITCFEDLRTEGFIEDDVTNFDQIEKLLWREISQYPMSKEFIKEHVDKLDWEYIFFENYFTMEELDEYAKYFDYDAWETVSQMDHLTKEFIEKYFDKLNIDNVIEHNKVCGKILRKALKLEKTDPYFIAEHQPFTIAVINILLQYGPYDWYDICKMKLPTIAALRKFESKIDVHWDVLCQYQTLNLEVYKEFEHCINWDIVSRHQQLTEEILIQYSNKINIKELMKNSHLNLVELEKKGIIMMLKITQ